MTHATATAVRVALIGGGDHARRSLAGAVDHMSGWSIVAVADPDADARRRIGETLPRARVHADHEALLSATDDIDVIVVATPPTVGASIARAAWDTRAAILLEKPGAVFAADLAGLPAHRVAPVSCAYGYRFHPTVMAFRQALPSLGALERLELCFNAPISNIAGSWRASRERGGGALRDLGAHLIDLARVLLPAPLILEHSTINSKVTGDDEATLSCVAGPAQLTVRCAYHGASAFSLTATGARGELRANLWSMTTPARGPLGALASRVRTKVPGAFHPTMALRQSRMAMLAAAITPSREHPPASVQDAACVLELIESAEAMAR